MCAHCHGTTVCARLDCARRCVLGRCVLCHGYTGSNRLTPAARGAGQQPSRG